jgi:hypothetical protein
MIMIQDGVLLTITNSSSLVPIPEFLIFKTCTKLSPARRVVNGGSSVSSIAQKPRSEADNTQSDGGLPFCNNCRRQRITCAPSARTSNFIVYTKDPSSLSTLL